VTTDQEVRSRRARLFFDRHVLRTQLSDRRNRQVAMTELLGDLADNFVTAGSAEAVFFTIKVWRDAPVRLIVKRPPDFNVHWPEINGRQELRQAHAGVQTAWEVPPNGSHDLVRCFSFCFSTNGRGTVAATAMGAPELRELLLVQEWLSPDIEAILIRDGLLALGSLKDMATLTRETLQGLADALDQVTQLPEGSRERITAQTLILIKVQELRQYTHFDRYLAEASALALAVTGQIGKEPLTHENIAALRHLFEVMWRIRLSAAEVDDCVERLRQGGLDVFLTFGGEGSVDD